MAPWRVPRCPPPYTVASAAEERRGEQKYSPAMFCSVLWRSGGLQGEGGVDGGDLQRKREGRGGGRGGGGGSENLLMFNGEASVSVPEVWEETSHMEVMFFSCCNFKGPNFCLGGLSATRLVLGSLVPPV